MGKQSSKKGALAIVSALWWLAKVLTALINAVVDLAKAQGLSDDEVDASVHRLGTPEGVVTIKQMAVIILKGSVSSVATAPAAVALKILALINSVRIPFAGRFAASEHFVVNTSSSAVAKVSYLSDNFKNWFLTKVEGGPGDVTLSYHQLLRGSVDAPIIAELGGEAKVETTLAAVWHLMCQQKNGEAGVLLTNGYANIFYIRDVSAVLRAVDVHWYGDGWVVGAYSTTYPNEWDAGDCIFSVNS